MRGESMIPEGFTEADWCKMCREMDADYAAFMWEQERRALRAIWCKPVVDEWATKSRTDGVVCYHDARDDGWTLWRAILATIAIFGGRHWSDADSDRHRARTGRHSIDHHDIAYWDSKPTYGGYTVDVVQLYPGCRVSIFNDGECLM